MRAHALGLLPAPGGSGELCRRGAVYECGAGRAPVGLEASHAMSAISGAQFEWASVAACAQMVEKCQSFPPDHRLPSTTSQRRGARPGRRVVAAARRRLMPRRPSKVDCRSTGEDLLTLHLHGRDTQG